MFECKWLRSHGNSYIKPLLEIEIQVAIACVCFNLSFFFLDFIYLFLERGERREKKRVKTSNVWLPFVYSELGMYLHPEMCPDWK